MPVYTKVPERSGSLTDHGGHLINIFWGSFHTFRTYGTKLMRGSISTHLLYLTAQTNRNRKTLTAHTPGNQTERGKDKEEPAAIRPGL